MLSLLTFLAVFALEASVGAVAVNLSELNRAKTSIEARILFGAKILQVTLNALAVEQSGRDLPHLQVGDQTLEGRLVLHRAGRQGREAHVRRDPAHKQVTDHSHLPPFGFDLSHLGLAVDHQQGLAEVAGEQHHMPAVVVHPRLHMQAGWLGAVDGEAQLQAPGGDEQLQEVAVAAVVQVKHQGFADVGLEAEAQLAHRSRLPAAVARPLARRSAELQHVHCAEQAEQGQGPQGPTQ